MANKYLDDDGTLYFWQKIKNKFATLASPTFTGEPKAPTAAAGTNNTQIATTAFVAAAVTASGGEANQNAFSNVKVGSTTVAADAKTDTLELVGSNVTLTPDATNDKVTIGVTASNVTTALGNTAVARATADASGNNIANTYAKKYEAATTGEGSGESVTVDSGARLRSLTVEGKSVQDGTPTPSTPVPIQTVGGANILELVKRTATINGVTASIGADGTITLSGQSTSSGNTVLTLRGANGGAGFGYVMPAGQSVSYSCEGSSSQVKFSIQERNVNTNGNLYVDLTGSTVQNSRPVPHQLRWVYLQIAARADVDGIILRPSINVGDAKPYVPYGSIGIAVRDLSDAVMSVTPIPLNGNVIASLPDGTKDVLTVDETGHCVITKNTNHIASYNGESVGSVYVATTGTLETGAEVYYKRSSGTTIDIGYITMPELADGCTVEILASLTPTFDASWYTGNGAALVDFATKDYADNVIAPTSGTVTLVYTGGGGQLEVGTGVWRSGNVATVHLQYSSTSSMAWNNETIASIPQEFAPSSDMRFPIFATADWTNMLVGYAQVQANGNIIIYSKSTKAIFGTFTYVIAVP